MNREMIKNFEGFYCVNRYSDRGCVILVDACRNIEPLLRKEGPNLGETLEMNFHLCLAYAQDEAKGKGKNVADIENMYGRIDPIYQCLKGLIIEWLDGTSSIYEYSTISSRNMQY